MQLPPEDRVNMSLDDLILAQKKQGNKGGNNSQGQSQGGNRRRNNRRPQSANAIPQQQGKQNNAIVSVGANKAKRSAAMNQRRGLNNSGTATKTEIQNSIRTQSANADNRNNRRRRGNIGGGRRGGPGGGPGVVTANRSVPNSRLPPTTKPVGLKISFNPAELNKTTDKAVAVQIKAALAKQISTPRQSTPIPPPNFLAPGSLSRQVFMPGSSNGGGGGAAAMAPRGQQGGRNRPRGRGQRRPVKG